MKNVAILGNHSVSYCTESDLAWTFHNDLKMGVLKLQENQTSTDTILRDCIAHKVEMLIYVHTHSWNTPGSFDLDELWKRLRFHGTKTVGFHLDRYWGLDKADRRESLIGQHPFWHCDYVFTADGGNQDRFRERGVNHYWLPPGVVKRACYDGQPDDRFKSDIIFVGQRMYHPEYPFRGELISWLERTYGSRFRLHPGNGPAIREDALNRLYASAKVIVGDTCFAGDAPNFWSDRLPETTGRGGFLLHPEIEGMTIPVATYKPKNLEDLKSQIDFWVSHDDERVLRRTAITEHARSYDTYTNRMEQLVKTVEDKAASA